MRVGEIWRIRFPYNDGKEGSKLRPALIVGGSPMGAGEEEVLLTCMITSQIQQRRNGDLVVPDFRAAGLSEPSLIKARRLFAASPRAFRAEGAERLGRLDTPTFQAVFNEIAVLF